MLKRTVACGTNWRHLEARGKKLGIIGYGHIGTQLGILAESLGMYVYFYDIENKLPLGNATQVQHLSDLLNMSDVVSSACTRESVHQKYDGRERNFTNEARLAAD